MRLLNRLTGSPTGSAEILSYADSSHYLVAISPTANSDTSYIKASNRKLRYFKSLFEAETFLYGLGYDNAVLKMQSAYDEISGEACEPAALKIPLTQ